MIGSRFGRLVVVRSAEVRNQKKRWHCECDCGGATISYQGSLRAGRSKSCGCLKVERLVASNSLSDSKQPHGLSKTRIYRIWSSMKQRCLNPLNPRWADYGGRGISICEKWMVFEEFFKDIGDAPSPAYSLDRIDNNAGYSPDNCRWATRSEQQFNRRRRTIAIGGRNYTIKEIAAAAGIGRTAVYERIKAGWPTEELISPIAV